MIYFLGDNSISTVRCNTMKNYTYGVVLDAVPTNGLGPIGSLTSPSDNQWLNAPMSGGSHTHCVNTAKGGSISWYVRNLSTYVPTINTIDVFPSTPVSPNTTATGNSICYPPPPPCGCPSCCRQAQIGGIVNNTISFTSDLQRWQAKDFAFRKLKEDTTWLNLGTPDDNTYQQFYNTHQAGNIGKFYQVELLAEAGGSSIPQASTINNSVNDTWLFETNQKTVYDIYLSTVAKGIDTFTTSQHQQLLDIAMQDVKTGGTGVYGARVMLGLEPNHNPAKINETVQLVNCIGPNLIPNSDFESVINCIGNPHPIQNYITNWYQPTGGETDYYNSCMTNSLWQTPTNACGYQIPKSGVAYGSIGGQNPPTNYREYSSVKLTDTLKNGKRYLVSFHLSLCDESKYAGDGIGIYISNDSIYALDSSNLPYIPQIEYSGVISDTANWVTVSGEYIANGDELYATIGMFYPDSLTNFAMVNPTAPGPWAAYILDDVSICEIDSTSGITETSADIQFKLYPNPANNTITLQYDLPLEQKISFEVWNITGKRMMIKTLPAGKQTTSFSVQDLNSGIYFYRVVSENKMLSADKIIVIK